jgi:hypothetical protein
MTEFDIGEEGQVLSLMKCIVLNGGSNVYLMPINECMMYKNGRLPSLKRKVGILIECNVW